MSATITIFGMAAITFILKALVFIMGDRIAFSPIMRQALSFVPVTVLTAIIVPMVLAPHGQSAELSWRNPHLVAAAFSVLVCIVTRHQLLTIMLGLVAFFSWQYSI